MLICNKRNQKGMDNRKNKCEINPGWVQCIEEYDILELGKEGDGFFTRV